MLSRPFHLRRRVAARLQRALIQLMLDTHVSEHSYTELGPPYLVNRDSMTATAHLPKFETEAYRTDPDDLFLVPTAEVPVTNLHRDEMVVALRTAVLRGPPRELPPPTVVPDAKAPSQVERGRVPLYDGPPLPDYPRRYKQFS